MAKHYCVLILIVVKHLISLIVCQRHLCSKNYIKSDTAAQKHDVKFLTIDWQFSLVFLKVNFCRFVHGLKYSIYVSIAAVERLSVTLETVGLWRH